MDAVGSLLAGYGTNKGSAKMAAKSLGRYELFPSYLAMALLILAAWCTPASAQTAAEILPKAGLDRTAYNNPNGNTHVVCLDDATQSYELYYPDSVPATGAVPIFYGFDPGGNGKGTLLSLANAAATNGWILAVSNNSKNGPWSDIFTAQDALIRDTEARLTLSPNRRFAGGMSGGARASLALAFRYPAKICGTLLLGAGWPVNTTLVPSTTGLNVYMIIGTQDSNYTYDIPQTQGKLVAYGIRTLVQTFAGGHVWPPANMVMAGCQWLNTNALVDPNSGLPPVACPAHSLFCQPPPGPDGAWTSYWGDTANQQSLFEHFENVALPIASLDWWGISAVYNEDVGYWLPSPAAAAQFIISVHPDNGGVPGPAQYQATVTADREELPYLFSRNYPLHHYHAFLSAPVTLSSGWIGIQQVRDSGAYEMVLNSPAGQGESLYLDGSTGVYAPLNGNLAMALETEELNIDISASGWLGKPPFEVNFRGTVSGNIVNIVNWRWDFGDGDVVEGDIPNPVHIYDGEGSYTVSLTVSTDISSASVTKRDLVLVTEAVPLATPGAYVVLLAVLASLGAFALRRNCARR